MRHVRTCVHIACDALQTLQTDREASLIFTNRYLHGVHAGEIYPSVIIFSDEAWCHLRENATSRNNRHWSAENSELIEVTLLDLKVEVWCAICATRIIWPIFSPRDPKITPICYTQFGTSF